MEIFYYAIQLAAFQKLFDCFKEMAIFNGVTSEDVKESFQATIRYALTYFGANDANPIDFWRKVLTLTKDGQPKKPSSLVVEIGLCAPFSNATLGSLFSKMNLVKGTVRNRLRNDSLNSLLRIGISRITLQEFHETYVKKCVLYWYNFKNCRLNQRKRKDYQKRQIKKATPPRFKIADLSSSLSDSNSSDCKYSNASDDDLQ